MRTEQRQGRRSWEQDPYLVEATLTLEEWRARRERPFVEIVTRHDDSRLNERPGAPVGASAVSGGVEHQPALG